MLLIQEYLQGHTLEDLRENFGIKIRRHTTYPNLISLKYGQIDSPLGDPMVQECRGLILDEEADWGIVSFPYKKFFNAHESHAATIDWSSASILEKLDGSLLQLFEYNDKWHCATSGTPDAMATMSSLHPDIYFDKYFWKVFSDLDYQIPEAGRTYMFELCSLLNRNVVPYKEDKLVLHGVRDLKTLRELEPAQVGEKYGWDVVKSYKMSNLDEVIEACKTLSPMESEGYVIRDGNFNRVKVKSPAYVSLHHLKNEWAPRRIMEAVRINEMEEILAYFPEFGPQLRDAKTKYNSLTEEITKKWLSIKYIADQKEFAVEATKERYAGILFMLRNGRVGSVQEGLEKMHIDKLLRMV